MNNTAGVVAQFIGQKPFCSINRATTTVGRIMHTPQLFIEYEGKRIGTYEPDFIIEDTVIVEVKSVLGIPKVFKKQLYYYLRSSNYRLGYLVNFGSGKIDIRRRIL